jgi:hypothetical protein
MINAGFIVNVQEWHPGRDDRLREEHLVILPGYLPWTSWGSTSKRRTLAPCDTKRRLSGIKTRVTHATKGESLLGLTPLRLDGT